MRDWPRGAGKIDAEAVSRLIAQVAAEEIMPRYAKLAAGDVREKGPGDLVTIADEAAEHRLTPALIQLLPCSVVVGEEAAAADPSVIDRLDGGDPVWVIDPVDGTANFAAAKGDFGVMVSLIQGGRTLAAWIYDPRTSIWQRRSWAAAPGSMACGCRYRTGPPPTPAELSGPLLGGQLRRSRRQPAGQSAPRPGPRPEEPSMRRGGICAACRGKMDFALFSKLMPWDHAAGVLLQARRAATAPISTAGAISRRASMRRPSCWRRTRRAGISSTSAWWRRRNSRSFGERRGQGDGEDGIHRFGRDGLSHGRASQGQGP
jgi:Archaeal fructose-1,6-bisphosphatase and related enzymes of inositol monophosphatase family